MVDIEVRAFGKLYFLLKDRGWPCPLYHPGTQDMTARDLLDTLKIPREEVEAVFINHRVMPLSAPVHPGDRVAFVPPGTPSVHRFNLGFYAAREAEKKE